MFGFPLRTWKGQLFIGGLLAINTLCTGNSDLSHPLQEATKVIDLLILTNIIMSSLRSHTDKTILLVKLGERYVPIAESAVVLLPEEREESEREASDSECREREERLLAKSISERLASESERLSKREGSRSLLSADSSRSLAGIPSISEKDEHMEEEEEETRSCKGEDEKVKIKEAEERQERRKDEAGDEKKERRKVEARLTKERRKEEVEDRTERSKGEEEEGERREGKRGVESGAPAELRASALRDHENSPKGLE